ncbi:L-rhamnose mutarotase [Frondihabitans sp. VKM Ac-2883]|uniref:L-rhamnose mutarotase n=1 Tax=Frondihabitans sp. VKM Ac-2883 TaxID=2783823 RepID=UPI00188CF526|nr:L-rhamnose mutarotase [Frondihabitans sp. VKM Ac-2883]
MQRICFVLRVKPEQLPEYERRHASVWPEMLRALAETGWRDYSLFSDGKGLVIGYLLTDDFDASSEAMAATDVNARWQRDMAPFFVDADNPTEQLTSIFHLETQLDSLSESEEPAPS